MKTAGKASATGEEERNGDIHMVLLGSQQKDLLFKKLAEAADKSERHIAYSDTHFLTFNINNEEHIVEVTDPGMSHTGGREMAIRRADCAVLFYSSLSVASFHQLSSLIEDFRCERKQMPIRLVCDEDEVIEDEEDEGSTAVSSVSEGYESDDPPDRRILRRSSMEKIRKAYEDGRISKEQGENLAAQLEATFMHFSVANFRDGRTFMEDLIRDVKTGSKKKRSADVKKRRFSIPNLVASANGKKEPKRSSSGNEVTTGRRRESSSVKSEKSSSSFNDQATWAEASNPVERNNNLAKEKNDSGGHKNSKVCAIM